jgi:hypothetical protein
MTLNPGLPWQKQYSSNEGYFHQQIELKFTEETNKVPQREQSFVWC